MTHEEEEEMQHYISKLRDQEKKNSLSQKVTEAKIDGLNEDMEDKMDGVKDNIEDWKRDMEGWREGLTKLLQERIPNGEKVVEKKHNVNKRNVNHDSNNGNIEYLKKDLEGLTKLLQERLPNDKKVVEKTHDENKRNDNHDFIDSNIGIKIHHIQNIDMRKFDGKDPITWIPQMEKYFELHNVKNTQKTHITTLYLEPNQFVWYRWLFSCKQIITWEIFMEEMIAHYEDTKATHFLAN